jgi:hypothetical protein
MSSIDYSKYRDGYICSLDLPPGWININLLKPSTAEAHELARQVAEDFNPLHLRISKASLVREISRKALNFKKDHSSFAAVYYTDAGQNLASLSVDTYGEDGVTITLEEVASRLLDDKRGKIVGEPEVKYLDVYYGPAVRLQTVAKLKGIFGLGRLIETVTLAICLPVIDDVVIITMWWEAMALSDEFTAMAETIIPTLRLIPCDEDGNPTDPDDLK